MNSWYKKFIPTYYFRSIYDVPYDKLIKEGVKALFFDLDNTILPYDIAVLPKDISEFLENLTNDFKIVIVSNSRKKRVDNAVGHLKGIPYVKFARKPLKVGFKQALKLANVKASEAYFLGDQLMTDIYGSNRIKFMGNALIYPVKKRSDHFFTRMNRRLEKCMLRKIKKKFPEQYEAVLKPYEEQK